MSSGIILNGWKAGLVGPNLWDFTFFGEFVDSFFLHLLEYLWSVPEVVCFTFLKPACADSPRQPNFSDLRLFSQGNIWKL